MRVGQFRFAGKLCGILSGALILSAFAAFQPAHAVTFSGTDTQFFGALGKNGLGNVDGYFEWFQDTSNSGSFTVSLTNTSDNPGISSDGKTGFITGFGFFLPEGIDISELTVAISTVSSSNTCISIDETCDAVQVTRNTFSGFEFIDSGFVPGITDIEFGGALGGNITGGGSPNGGIAVGDTGVFEFSFVANSGDLNLTTSSFVPENGNFWCTRWRGFEDGNGSDFGEGSDAQCGSATQTTDEVPEPGALALLGFGLIGIAVVRRRKRAC